MGIYFLLFLDHSQMRGEVDDYKPAYPNVPQALDDCEFAKSFFQKNFMVKSEDIFEMKNCTKAECRKQYMLLVKRLVNNPNVNHLVFHVFAGHGW